VDLVVSTASMVDETAARAHVVLPDHTPLESWGDAEAREGVRSLLQPTVRPLMDTQALVDTLHAVGRGAGAMLPDESFKTLVEEAWSATNFREALANGGRFAAPTAVAASLSGSARLEVDAPMLEGDGGFVLLAYPHALLYDGRGANLPWLQEVPDPVTKVAWQSWAEISNNAAEKLGVATGDVLRIETSAGAIEVSALVRGGIRDDVIAVPIGQGHTQGYYASLAGDGQPGEARGSSVISVLPSVTDENGGRAWLTTNAKVSATGGFQRVPTLQTSDNKRERMLGEMLPLAALTGHGETEAHHGANLGPVYAREHGPIAEFDAADDADDGALHRWGMAIDLDKCNGCSACVAACYIENNVPVVGEEGVLRGRVMSWLRINRWPDEGEVDYTASDGRNRRMLASREKLGQTDIRHSPQLCQQCGAAPCEPVCPALATMHNREGLNAMVYNRCLGTRYCSNNCPYKVRRFNYFDYSQHNWPGLMGLMLNPDVTVRGQGVMEKCTFCVQRIEGARQLAMDEGRAIADGEVISACAQACPTEAITFGNLRDPNSRASKRSDDDKRGYRALHALNTRPAITYLAKVKRGSVEG
jgi:Fe-S-cluster-containing dehydrogenase component